MITEKLSIKGQRHVLSGENNQDRLFEMENDGFAVIILSDGVSSCKRSEAGAEITAKALAGLLLEKGDYFFSVGRTAAAMAVLDEILRRLRKRAELDDAAIEEYSATAVGVLFHKRERKLFYFNLGDGIIIAAGSEGCRTLAPPQDSHDGCCVCTTKGAVYSADCGVVPAENGIDSIMLCSDGAWHQLYRGSRLKPEVRDMLTANDYGRLGDFLAAEPCGDDMSFIALKINTEETGEGKMSTRDIIKGEITLCETRGDSCRPLKFTVESCIGEGGSAVCYEAVCEDKRGVLKEFYPYEIAAVRSASDNQLTIPENDLERYRELRGEFLDTCQTLAGLINAKGSEVSTFIPDFYIYYGRNGDGTPNDTVYIWQQEQTKRIFSEICEDIQKNPTVSPKEKLRAVLMAIYNLTNCLIILHKAGMVHRDIKPANFGFVKRNNQLLTQMISMFDTDTICPILSDRNVRIGTAGYYDPQDKIPYCDVCSDIYAVGASLLDGIAVQKKNWGFAPEQYPELEELVNNSPLIKACEGFMPHDAYVGLKRKLIEILQKCLCERKSRYQADEELLAGLEEARKKLEMIDAEKSTEKKAEAIASEAIKYYLYKEPMYRYAEKDKDIRVLVIGFGNYGQKFMDACLQLSGASGKDLDVTVISGNRGDKENYLSARPALSEFFEIDGGSVSGGSYGKIRFEDLFLSESKMDGELRGFIYNQYGKGGCADYIFIALGDDKLNTCAAKACRKSAKGAVNYVMESKAQPVSGCFPVFVREKPQTQIYRSVERMAFNVHSIWEKGRNVSHDTIYKNFKNPYNHESSVKNVLALKYFLFGLGIDLDRISAKAAAEQYIKLCDEQTKNRLMCLEHRRWVTDMVCRGFTYPKGKGFERLKEFALNGTTKDERTKEHICLVRSRPERKFRDITENNLTVKDVGGEGSLDGIDSLSYNMKRIYDSFCKNKEKDDTYRYHKLRTLKTIHFYAEGDTNALIAFREWHACVCDIENGDREKVQLYDGLRERLEKSFSFLSADEQKDAKDQVAKYHRLFIPFLKRAECRDFKKDDESLIDNIPFILTYRTDFSIIVPYSCSPNEEFQNVAAAAVLDPKRIVYLYLVESDKDMANFFRSVSHSLSFMQKMQLRAKLEILFIMVGFTLDEKGMQTIHSDLEKKSAPYGKRAVEESFIFCRSKEEVIEKTENILCRKKRGMQILMLNSTVLSSAFELGGVCRKIPSCKFTPATMKFTPKSGGCEMLSYITRRPHVSASDMLSFSMSYSSKRDIFEYFGEYTELWDIYKNNTAAWKSMCVCLAKSAEQSDFVAALDPKAAAAAVGKSDSIYILPLSCRSAAEEILRQLKAEGIAGADSKTERRTSDSIRVAVKNICDDHKRACDKIFSLGYALSENMMTVYKDSKNGRIVVKYNNLAVSDAEFPIAQQRNVEALLNSLCRNGYIINLSCVSSLSKSTGDKFSFVYATPKVKELLTVAGKVLEIYVYHKCRASGCFDDVISGCEIKWHGDNNVINEIDCIVTNGFRALFVECKARKELQEGFYNRMAAIRHMAGIDVDVVLVADTLEQTTGKDPTNDTQRQRGEMLNIPTIWEQDKIENIDKTLLQLMEGQ